MKTPRRYIIKYKQREAHERIQMSADIKSYTLGLNIDESL